MPVPQRVLPSTTVIIYEPPLPGLATSWRVLCHQRSDNGLWGFVGGGQEVGESLPACAVREAKEETGLEVELLACCAVDSDPTHGAVLLYPDGGCVQYMNVTFTARILGGTLQRSAESLAFCWASPERLPQPFAAAHAWRLRQALSGRYILAR